MREAYFLKNENFKKRFSINFLFAARSSKTRDLNQIICMVVARAQSAKKCTKYDENRWLNTKLFQKKRREVLALKRQYVYSALL